MEMWPYKKAFNQQKKKLLFIANCLFKQTSNFSEISVELQITKITK